MPKEVKIIVAGRTNTGKSTITKIIKDALKEKGFEVNFQVSEDFISEQEFDSHFGGDMQQRVGVLKDFGIKLTLSEQQLQREPLNS